jgi:hypothetical protein
MAHQKIMILQLFDVSKVIHCNEFAAADYKHFGLRLRKLQAKPLEHQKAAAFCKKLYKLPCINTLKIVCFKGGSVYVSGKTKVCPC